ncbi:MAG TPA: chloride channel protein [Acidimicrobiia bacterium]|nr:chloride channel protein [Acidimicrobiia bacterium]
MLNLETLKTQFEKWRRTPAVEILTEKETTGLLAVAAIVGLGIGVGAAALVRVIEGIENGFVALEQWAGGTRWWVFVAVPLGFWLAWQLARSLAPEVEGDGVPDVIAALALHAGRVRGAVIPTKIVATALTLGGGGSGGREGPIVQIGSATGSVISRFFRLGQDQIRSMVAAGAGAGIGASFNAPIAGMLFALEVILRSFAVRHMSAIVIASVVAAITTRSLVGQELTLRATSHTVDDFRQLLLYVGLALLAAIAGVILLKVIAWIDSSVRPQVKGWLRPVSFGLLVATIGFFIPEVLGTGQQFLQQLLFEAELAERAGISVGQVAWWGLALLAVAKLVATAFTTTSGAAGGAFFPSLFIGGVLGAAAGRLVEPFWTVSSVEPGALAVVGMATMVAAVARAPLTAMMLVFEITGGRDYGLILPLMLGTTLATFLADRLHPGSIYVGVLRRRGITITDRADLDILDTVTVGQVMYRPHIVARPDQQVAAVRAAMTDHRYHGVVVLDEDDLAGIVTISDLVRAGPEVDQMTVGEVMTRRPATVTPATPVSQALERMAGLGVGRLPVVAEDGSGRFLGLFRREEAVRAYHQALAGRTDQELVRRRLDQRTDPGAGYYDFRIPAGSMADGKLVQEVAWPAGSTLVSIRRQREVLVPTGGSQLIAGDVITAFGTPASRNEMIERLNAGAEEPTAEIVLEPPDESTASPAP